MLYWSRVSGFSSLMFLSLVYSLLYAILEPILEPSVWILLFNVFKFSILPSLCYIGAECLEYLLFNVFKFSILPSLCYIGAECLDSPL